jgi:hypothetical protein
MPVLKAQSLSVPSFPSTPIEVTFGWKAGVQSAIPAATIWVAPTGAVTNAIVWPPVAGKGTVAVIPVRATWPKVRSGTAPVAVVGANFFPLTPGTGETTAVEVVQVLVTPSHGAPALVPAYRFSGTVDLQGHGRHSWYALVPAAKP